MLRARRVYKKYLVDGRSETKGTQRLPKTYLPNDEDWQYATREGRCEAHNKVLQLAKALVVEDS